MDQAGFDEAHLERVVNKAVEKAMERVVEAVELRKSEVSVMAGAGQNPPVTTDAPVTTTEAPQPSLSQDPVRPHMGYKKVLVTGGAGFIGSHVAEAFLKRGDDVVIIDEMNDHYNVSLKEANLRELLHQYPPNNNRPRLVIYKGDICDEALLHRIFETERPYWICHLAARAGVRPSIKDPYVYIHSNVEGTARLLDASRSFGVQNFVFASSSSVYALSKSSAFSENESVDRPISPYAATKKSAELIAHTFHHLYGIKMSGVRFFTVYGPRGRPDMAPFMFMDRISRGLEIEQFGDGSTSRDYTYIDDIVDGVVRAVDRPYQYEIFNLGKGGGTKLSDFIHLMEEAVGTKAKIIVKPNQDGDVPFTRADITKSNALLGYQPNIPVQVGVNKMVAWYKNYTEMLSHMEQQRQQICFVSMESKAEQRSAVPEELRKSNEFKFLLLTGNETLERPGWERVLVGDSNDMFQSEFLSWKIPVLQDSCRAVFYADSAFVPSAKATVWKELADRLQTSVTGMIQLVQSDPDIGDQDRQWLKEQKPKFREKATMYATGVIGYDPSNVWMQQATLMYWALQSKKQSKDIRKDVVWSYVADRLSYSPTVLGQWPQETFKYWQTATLSTTS